MATTVNTGRCTLVINGQSCLTTGDLTIQAADVEAETLIGLDGVHGVKEKPVAPRIEGSIRLTPSITVAALKAAKSVTITVQDLSGGVYYSLPNAWRVGSLDVDPTERMVKVMFEGRTLTTTNV